MDDDANVRESLGGVPTQEHYAVKLPRDGRVVVRQFLDSPADLILLDVNMPDITGSQAFQVLAQLYPFVPVVINTACPGQSHGGLELGINEFMEKPLAIPILLRSIRKLLAHSDSARFAEISRCWKTNDH